MFIRAKVFKNEMNSRLSGTACEDKGRPKQRTVLSEAIADGLSTQVMTIFMTFALALMFYPPFDLINESLSTRILLWLPFILISFPSIIFNRTLVFSLNRWWLLPSTLVYILIIALDIIGLTIGTYITLTIPSVKLTHTPEVDIWQVTFFSVSILSLATLVRFAVFKQAEIGFANADEFSAEFSGKCLTEKSRNRVMALVAENQYVRIISDSGEEYRRQTLKDAIQELPPNIGMKVHRSYWVAFSAIKEFHNKKEMFVKLENGMTLRVSARYREDLEVALTLLDLV